MVGRWGGGGACLLLLVLKLLHGGGEVLYRPVHQGQRLQVLLLPQLFSAHLNGQRHELC
jgi:hypothetical protein